MKRRVCHEIVLDKDAYTITLVGQEFPYYVAVDPEVVGTGELEMGGLALTIFANNIIVKERGQATYPVVADHRTELAREEGRRIVREGLTPSSSHDNEPTPIYDALVADRQTHKIRYGGSKKAGWTWECSCGEGSDGPFAEASDRTFWAKIHLEAVRPKSHHARPR